MNKVGEALPRQRPVFANNTVAPRRSGPGPGSSARNAWAAILSGITFIILFTAGLVLINQIPRLDSPDSTYVAFYATRSRGLLVTVGLHIVPFSSIAFLWFMMAFRALLDRPADLAQGLALLVYAAWVLLVSLGLFRIARVRLGRPAEGASRGVGHHPHTFRKGFP